jgi:hypothetical protein
MGVSKCKVSLRSGIRNNAAGDGVPDLVMLRQHLAMVEGHIAKGLKSIDWQRAVIDRLAAKGLDLVRAKGVLRFLSETQELHQQHHDRLRSQLGLKPDSAS